MYTNNYICNTIDDICLCTVRRCTHIYYTYHTLIQVIMKKKRRKMENVNAMFTKEKDEMHGLLHRKPKTSPTIHRSWIERTLNKIECLAKLWKATWTHSQEFPSHRQFRLSTMYKYSVECFGWQNEKWFSGEHTNIFF